MTLAERLAGVAALGGIPAITLGVAPALGAERRQSLGQPDQAEAPDAQGGRELLRRPRRDPHLLAERVHRLHGGDEVVVTGDEHGRLVGVVRRVVDEVGHQARVDALLGRVVVLRVA